ncbi:AimR family lysis-lysogeny pheromone receptor [Bacillus safensis]|uniref:AimR family lysis-lysogeny pheromone receptor n=1 Tax=Bacillus safensis TaxID=561879 RepID=UPI0004022DC3|nr:AimR family lysis-lysogeny pheromone receptor [Bacillus safensis]
MQSIKDDFINLREKYDLSITCISTKTGINQDVLYEFADSGSIGFKHLVTLSKFFYKEKYHETMREWCMKIDSPEWLKQAFEYAALKRDSDLLGMLLEKSKEEHGIKQFLDMYGLILDFMVDRIDFRELSDRMSSLKVSSSKDLKILKDIYACVFMYYDDEFIGITKNASLIYKEIVKLGKRRAFIKEAFSYRLSEILAPAYLHLNEPKLCMFHANVLVSTGLNNKHISDGNYYIGMCKLHEDKTSCLTHMEKSLHFAKETKEPLLIREATNNLNMVKSLFSFIEGGSAPVFAGEKEKFLLGGDADFVVYFNYVRNREITNVYAAYKHFFEEMNFFFASIAAETLRMFGVDDIQIDVLKSFKLKSKGDVVYEKDFIDGFCFRGTSCIAS